MLPVAGKLVLRLIRQPHVAPTPHAVEAHALAGSPLCPPRGQQRLVWSLAMGRALRHILRGSLRQSYTRGEIGRRQNPVAQRGYRPQKDIVQSGDVTRERMTEG